METSSTARDDFSVWEHVGLVTASFKWKTRPIHTEIMHLLDLDRGLSQRSFDMCSAVPLGDGRTLDNNTLTYKFLPMSASHLVLYGKEV